MVVVGGDVDEDERSDGDVAEDEEVLFSMICRVFGFSPCLQNSVTGLVVSRMYFGLSPVKLTFSWSWMTWLSFNGLAELVFQLKTRSSLAFSNS